MNLVCVFLLSLPVWAFLLAVVALLCLLYAPQRVPHVLRRGLRFFPATEFLRMGFMLGTVGPNETIASTTRTANTEAVVFQAGNSTYSPLFQGAHSFGSVQVYSTTAPAIAVPPGGTTVEGGLGAIGGAADISGSTVLAATLALPAAGPTSSGGIDGTLLFIFNDTTGKAHTVTTPTNGIQGSFHVITMAASGFSSILLMAYNGSWWVVVNTNCTIS